MCDLLKQTYYIFITVIKGYVINLKYNRRCFLFNTIKQTTLIFKIIPNHTNGRYNCQFKRKYATSKTYKWKWLIPSYIFISRILIRCNYITFVRSFIYIFTVLLITNMSSFNSAIVKNIKTPRKSFPFFRTSDLYLTPSQRHTT